jgi:hypothetical protein
MEKHDYFRVIPEFSLSLDHQDDHGSDDET